MLTRGQMRLVRDLVTKKKVREQRGLMLVEGAKYVKEAGNRIEFSFTNRDVANFAELISTETPQSIAAVVRTPSWNLEEVLKKPTVVVLDGVQDPGNVGTILRSALGFDAGVILVASADVTNPKTVRSSAGAVLRTPWVTMSSEEAEEWLLRADRPVYRLELTRDAVPPSLLPKTGKRILVAGNEGSGIRLNAPGQSVAIHHHPALESLNVGIALSLVLYELHRA